MEEKKINKSIAFSIVAVLLLVIVVAGSTFAYFRAAGETDVQTITTANLKMSFVDGETFSPKLQPIDRDEMLTKAAKKTFTITNTGEEKMFVHISMEDLVLPEALKRYDFLWSLYEDGKSIGIGSFEFEEEKIDIAEYRILDTADRKTHTYDLYIWIEETGIDQVAMMGKTFSTKIKAVGETYHATADSCFELTPNSDNTTGSVMLKMECSEKDTVIIPETINGITVTKITTSDPYYVEDYATANTLVIPDTVTSIGSDLKISPLNKVVLGNSVEDLGYAMSDYRPNFPNISNIILPGSVTSIGRNSFGNSLKKLVLPNNITTLGEDQTPVIGIDTQITKLILPKGITELKNYLGDCDTSKYVFTHNVSILGGWDGCSGDFIIPNGVTTIGDSAFFSYNLTSVTIPNTVTSIGTRAFQQNNLTSVTIPSSVTSIGSEAFFENYSLESITLDGRSSIPSGFASDWNKNMYYAGIEAIPTETNINVIFNP